MTIYAPQIDLPTGSHAPDSWDAGKGVHLPLDHVITRDADGLPLSLVGDFIWDFTYYRPRKQVSRLTFWYWRDTRRTIEESELTPQRIARIREIQYLMFLRIYRSERAVGFQQLTLLKGLLADVATFAEKRGCSVREVFESSERLDAYIASMPMPKCQVLMMWISFLRSMDPVYELGFDLAKPKLWDHLVDQAKRYRDSHSQYAPLPTRIYLQLIQVLGSEFDALEAHLPRIQAAVREAVILNGRGGRQLNNFGPELIAKYALEGFLSEYECEANLSGLSAFLTFCQRLAKLQIHVFSGMRDEEARYLPYHCLELQNNGHGRKTAWIRGVTTKLSGGRRKRTGWVSTVEQGHRAVLFAQGIAALIYEVIGVSPSSVEDNKDSFPLFVSTGYLPWIKTASDEGNHHAPSQFLKVGLIPESIKNKLYGVIDKADLDELEAIDPFRDWASESAFEVGKRWHLTTHQLRRSLALYANASGLVKSSSLRRQLQHITSEMSYYYGRGSAYAKNFLKDDPKAFKEHIAFEWQDSAQEAQYLAFTRDVLNADEPLCGPAGVFYDLQKKRGEVMSEQEVKAQLKAGRMAYKAHPLGGCTHVGTCNKQKGLRLTSGICVSESCKSLIGKHSKIIKLIPVQRNIVAHLDPDSIAYQMEREELELLDAAEVQWRQPTVRKGWAEAAATVAQKGEDASLLPAAFAQEEGQSMEFTPRANASRRAVGRAKEA